MDAAAATARLRQVAADNEVDPEAAVGVATELAQRRHEDLVLVTQALAQQLEAGVDLDAAASALAAAEDPDS